MPFKAVLDRQQAEAMLDAAELEAQHNDWAVSIAVVDDGGYLLAFRRLQGASASSVQIAIDKARCSALTRRPTRFFAELINAGQLGVGTLPGIVAMVGGLPVVVAGQVVGAIAASGVKAEFDAQIASAGLRSVMPVSQEG
ncbi:GlcG/HbpS family heme-binding protein [Pseudomonas vanderleydeniana]|uniref:Heme-binding protein n=1 Tax=Pseudomonas vanderleydeniana TaxID=2745495 RepID=A0A9E6PH52_9PSED|nr:heme-binding protein [Pseudomonas vanderleydeniana]QXI26388.1 heme-binding protein [Pseudomonas vanderleydeniana]